MIRNPSSSDKESGIYAWNPESKTVVDVDSLTWGEKVLIRLTNLRSLVRWFDLPPPPSLCPHEPSVSRDVLHLRATHKEKNRNNDLNSHMSRSKHRFRRSGRPPDSANPCSLHGLLLVLSFAPRGFSPSPPVFPSPQKPAFSNSNLTRNQEDEEPLCGCATSKSLFIYLFIYLFRGQSNNKTQKGLVFLPMGERKQDRSIL